MVEDSIHCRFMWLYSRLFSSFQWHKLWGATKKVELARTHTRERGWERLLYSIRMDSWRSEFRARGRPKTTWRRTAEKERNKAGWKSWEIAKAVAQDRKCCQTAWRPYAPTGAIRLDDDDDPSFFTSTLYFWVKHLTRNWKMRTIMVYEL